LARYDHIYLICDASSNAMTHDASSKTFQNFAIANSIILTDQVDLIKGRQCGAESID